MPSKKRRRPERRTIHPRNRYSDCSPDFGLLASLYPSFKPHVFYTRDGCPRIDWTDFNATRELTRALLLHDHGLGWWIPDGQLCPTVPNRSNYIHWIEDLLASEIIRRDLIGGSAIMGFDIGTGANCIYPLLGASLLGWSFVGSDVTDAALEWAARNVESNPHISELIEIRKAESATESSSERMVNGNQLVGCGSSMILNGHEGGKDRTILCSSHDMKPGENQSYSGPPILLGVVKDGENFEFCMCNPPFFNSMEEAGLNPKTSCGGTPEEMVCHGGERAFITRIIEDSVVLKQTFRWYTSMVGRKANLKTLVSKLWDVGVTIVKTTEFVQGQTCRWGLAWSFMPPFKKIASPHVVEKSMLSFMMEGLPRQFNAIRVLQVVEAFFLSCGASCRFNAATFTVDIAASKDHCDAILRNATVGWNQMHGKSENPNELRFRISVFQQIAGTLLVKGLLQHKQSPISGALPLVFQQVEEVLRGEFSREKKTSY